LSYFFYPFSEATKGLINEWLVMFFLNLLLYVVFLGCLLTGGLAIISGIIALKKDDSDEYIECLTMILLAFVAVYFSWTMFFRVGGFFVAPVNIEFIHALMN
jgi:hypothetical protein